MTEEAVFAARSLRTFPNRGRKIPESDDPEIRELFVKTLPFDLSIEPRRVLIVAFIHGAREFRTILTQELLDLRSSLTPF
uniref:type II toxin-antitoxin system RelE/ParE family toxin n=1 Tax=Nevskia soli TaxID=418856 RepID=UPI001C5CAE4A